MVILPADFPPPPSQGFFILFTALFGLLFSFTLLLALLCVDSQSRVEYL